MAEADLLGNRIINSSRDGYTKLRVKRLEKVLSVSKG